MGFEPMMRFRRIHAFQACAFDRSATSPYWEKSDGENSSDQTVTQFS